VRRLHDAAYKARPERSVVITIAGFDWNCPQHIPRRLTLDELEPHLAPVREELARLEEENRRLKAALAERGV
jgi:predicted pyridoxine 5'-phosphate oxidase superfamily flavin-nucleotide-binding protein